MKKAIVALIFILGSVGILLGQDVLMKGRVLDMETGEGLISANVQVGDKLASTDFDGNFEILTTKGEHIVTISYVGYDMITKNVLIQDENERHEFQMELTSTLLETATITGSKFEQRLAESTVSIDVIKPDLITSINSVTADEVLNKIPGVQILDDQPNIRGGSGWSFGAGSRVMLLIDDIPALQADAGLAQWNDIPIENIAQVEVVKGAASALYGSAALNGIINFRTGYATSDPETTVSVFHRRYLDPKDKKKKWWTGTPHNTGVSLLHKQKFGKLDVVVGGYYYNQDSTATYEDQTFNRKSRINANLRYRLSDRVTLGVNSFFNDGRSSSTFIWKNAAEGAYQFLNGTISTSKNLRYIIDPYVNIFDKAGNKHRLQGRYYFIDNENNQGQANSSKLLYGEYQFQKKFDSKDLTLTSGILTTYVQSDSELFADTLISSNNHAAYLQLDKRFMDRLNVSLGGRYEHNIMHTPMMFDGKIIPGGQIDEGKFVGRVGANFELDEATFLRASWGQGYRFPTIVERFVRTAVTGFGVFPNADLISETGWSAELGLKQGFRLFGFEGFLDFSGFWSEYDNMMEFTFHTENGEAGFQSQNVGDTQIKGFEISIMGRSEIMGIPVRLFGGYTNIDPIYLNFNETLQQASSSDENVLKYRTRSNFTFDIEAEHKGVTLGLAMNGASHMKAIDQLLGTIAQINDYRNFNNMGFKKFDIRMGYTYKNWKLSVLLNNALNEEYTLRPAQLEAPRNLGFRLDFKV